MFDVPYPTSISPVYVNVHLAAMRDCALILHLNGERSYRIQYMSLSALASDDGQPDPQEMQTATNRDDGSRV